MKKILFTYLGVILVIVIISSLFTKWDKDIGTLKLPETISVYVKEENQTREMNFEEYIVNAVAAEMPASFHEEALKAQSVAVRTYIYNKYKKFTENPSLYPEEHKDAVVCTDSTHCCAYSSEKKLEEVHGGEWMAEFYNKIKKCVKETKGEVILYDNQPIIAVFHASSGGCRTENSQDVWSSSLPYLVSVESPDEDKREGYNTQVNVSCGDFKEIVNTNCPEAQLDDDRNNWLGDITYTKGNSVNEIKIGNASIKGTKVRSMFGLKSACFEVSMLNDTVTFNVHGSGHGVGMSQHGANIMAQNGALYKDILASYYTGTEVKK